MTLDYRKGAPRARRRPERRGTCAFWFLAGALVGGFGVGFAWMTHDETPAAELADQSTVAAPAEREKPRFDFPNLLQDEEVLVPKETPPQPIALPPPAEPDSAPPPTAKAAPPAAAPAPAATSSGPDTFILQVGSFRKSSDAEQLKAKLALLGVQTSVQMVTIANGQTYHRVRTGAYTKSDADIVRARLESDGHEALMMRAR
ncbi:MAG: SPOR domain-containing protein [Thiohalocapsa sp.]|jgi:cell division protein FtsN|nr:SPOR domain-containing protein [Thiohalocapsa sp.]